VGVRGREGGRREKREAYNRNEWVKE